MLESGEDQAMRRTFFLRDTAGLKELCQTDDGNRMFLKAGRTRQ
ncbi:hypothetical protein HMPREF3213_02925 [Heyndrickxia coagulans]|uniref:Uncharacterized protein n=1 Tax=Heyndrickxia coagulans TaxID=1398 RepID=A0A133KGL3_HEYCO|nr:hypothetical protein HMPREF3213_02925 [Heyndrickxia coagulans]